MITFFPLFGRGCVSCLEYYTIIYQLLTVVTLMLDAALFQTLIQVPPETETSLDIYQCIIIPVHCLQATLQFFFGFDLYKAVVRRSYRRGRTWRTIFLCFLAVEFSIFVAYIALATFFSVFTYVIAFVLVFKAYLTWPLKLFLDECQEVCVPIARSSSSALNTSDNLDAPLLVSRPGPSAAIKSSA